MISSYLFPVLMAVFASAQVAALNEDAPSCYMPIDVIFLQDTTGSFLEDLPIVTKQIPKMVEEILVQNPNSHFGVAEFKDKPFYPLGSNDDECYKLNGPLSPSVSAFQEAYGDLYASGGGDLPEAQYQALIDLAEDPNAGWRPIDKFEAGVAVEDPAFAGARLIIMSTDALPHLSGDTNKFHSLYPDTVPANLNENPGTTHNQKLSDLCTKTDYPTPQQVKDALKANSIYLAILTPNQANITGAWKWVNEQLLEQPAGFYQFIESDSSDIMEGVLKVMKEVTAAVCAEPTAPPTTTSTTQPSTTTTAATTTTTAATTTTTAATTTTTAATTPTTATTTVPTAEQPTTTTNPATTPSTTASTTASSTLSTSTTTRATTTPSADVTTAQPASESRGTTRPGESSASTGSSSDDCNKPCPEVCVEPCKDECCQRPAVRVELARQPKRLSLQFE